MAMIGLTDLAKQRSGSTCGQAAAPAGVHWLTPPLFVALATELAAFCVLLGVYAVFRASHPDLSRSDLRFPHWGWGAAQLAVVLLACLSVWAAARSLRQRRRAAAMVLAAIAVMYGLVSLGIKALEWSRWGGPHVIHLAAAPGASAGLPPKAGPATKTPGGDAMLGSKLYAATCAACHGPKAEGVPQVGPALRENSFVTGSSDAQLAGLIANGRTANDPANKTGKVMPPRGGNPFLTDTEVTHLAAYLKGLGRPDASGASAPDASAAAPVPEPGRWVVPAPPPQPAGLAPGFEPPAWRSPLPAAVRAQQPSPEDRAIAPLLAAISALYAVHLAVAAALAAGLIHIAYARRLDPADEAAVQFSRVYWALALLMGAVAMPFLYFV